MRKISVVLPVYNGERFLEESIQSILSQSLKDWELIIVDDASTDRTPLICADFAKQDDRIVVITNQTNQKLPISLNIGFRRAAGQYCTWTSDDNRYAPEAFRIMAEALDEDLNCAMVFCDQYFMDETGRIIGNNQARNKQDMAKKIYLRDCIGGCFMYRRAVINAIGEYDPDMFLVEDYDYWVRLSARYNIKYLPVIPYFYRTHAHSLTSTKRNDVRKQLLKLKLKHFDSAFNKLTNNERVFIYACIALADRNAAVKIKNKLIEYGCCEDMDTSWIDKKRVKDAHKKYIIFGAGQYGAMALKELGKENVAFFADNFQTGYYANTGIKIISFEEMARIYKTYNILIAANETNAIEIAMKFEANGVKEYLFSVEELNG